LIHGSAFKAGDLYTIRKGELVFDNLRERLMISDKEMIKIRERDEGGCIHYDAVSRDCRVYENRPSQCAALKCWDRSEFDEVFSGAKLVRDDLVKDPVLEGMIREHEKRCGYEAIDGLVRQIEFEGERAVADILTRLRFDFQIRPFVAEKLKIDPDHMDLYFGRPLIHTIKMFGLEVRKEPDGSFLLTTTESKTG